MRPGSRRQLPRARMANRRSLIIGRAVCTSASFTWSGVSVPPAACYISATVPATFGEAIDVPDAQVLNWPKKFSLGV
jgi:hypothetical protein